MSEHICELTPIDSETWDTTIGEEIVRCRDCKHFQSYGGDYLFCNLAARELDGGNGFCAWGERRGD